MPAKKKTTTKKSKSATSASKSSSSKAVKKTVEEETIKVPEVKETPIEVETEGIGVSHSFDSKINLEDVKDVQPTKKSRDEYVKYIREFDSYPNSIERAMFKYCFAHNIFFNTKLLEGMLQLRDDEVEIRLPDLYVAKVKKIEKYKDLDFFGQIKMENFEKLYSEDLTLLSLDEEDKKNRQQVITIIGYDPFKEASIEDRPQLYRDLNGLLNESMRKDVAKQKAAIQICQNYCTLAKYQKKINSLMNGPVLNNSVQEEIDNLQSMVGKIQQIINSTTKENGFTSNKTIGSNGRGMLSDVMNQVETQSLDEGITNFYDIATSKSIEEIAKISWKAMLDQVRFSQTEYVDILTQQAELVQKSIAEARKAMEALRLAKEKITKQKLLEELAADYRRKGIDESEIEDFLACEYKMWEK